MKRFLLQEGLDKNNAFNQVSLYDLGIQLQKPVYKITKVVFCIENQYFAYNIEELKFVNMRYCFSSDLYCMNNKTFTINAVQ